MEIESHKPEDTFRLGALVGNSLKGGECIELSSDLGGGKTVFVRGLAKGAGSQDQVASPTFTISREYKTKQFVIHHFDLYRLEETGIVGQELEEAIADSAAVVVIEWAAVANDVLPADRLTVKFVVTNQNARILELTAGPKHKQLLKNLK